MSTDNEADALTIRYHVGTSDSLPLIFKSYLHSKKKQREKEGRKVVKKKPKGSGSQQLEKTFNESTSTIAFILSETFWRPFRDF